MTSAYFFNLLLKHKTVLFIAIGLMILESAVSLAVPWFAGKFSQALLNSDQALPYNYLEIASVWFLIFIFQAVFRFFSSYRINWIGAQLLTQLSCRLYDHIQLLPLKYFNNTKKGETLALLSNDVNIISYFLTGVLTSLIPTILVLLGSLILMMQINSTITFIVVALIPAFFLLLKLLGRGIKPISEELVEKQANALAVAGENINVISLIKAFNREETESTVFKNNSYDIQQLRKKQLKIQAILSPIVQLLVSTGILAIILVSALYYQSGDLTLPDLITLLMYGLLFSRPMSALANLYGQIQQARGASKRLTAIFKLSPEPKYVRNSKPILIKGNITFEHVNFSYQQKCIYSDVNLTIKQGETIVFYGDNGLGKSTLLHLLMRFIAPSSGVIKIDNHLLNHIDLSSLRDQLGLISQDIALCNGTIVENIAYGFPQANLLEIKAAAKKAGADAFIEELTLGYQTPVGENGALLSGGQRQRIALARCLLTAPKVLLFDEPTSMIDKEGNEDFRQNIKQITEGLTAIIITHDQDMFTIADRVLTIKDRKIIEIQQDMTIGN